jgi:hypothetical protein
MVADFQMKREYKDMDELLPDIYQYIDNDIVKLFAEVNQPRSKFQLENFVLKQHDTSEMQYVQCLTELESLYYTVRSVSLKLKKDEIEIKRLRETGDEIDEIEAQLKELGIEQTRLVGVGTFREIKILLDLLKTFPRYTREEIEKAQPDYWNKRLTRQYDLQVATKDAGAAGHLNSLIQSGAVEYNYPEFVKEVE